MEFGTGSITNMEWDTVDDDFDIEKTHFNIISSWATHKHTYTDILKPELKKIMYHSPF